MVGVPALALGIDSMWALPLGKKRELLGILRVDVGGPTGSDGEEDDEEDEEEVAGKAPMDDSDRCTSCIRAVP